MHRLLEHPIFYRAALRWRRQTTLFGLLTYPLSLAAPIVMALLLGVDGFREAFRNVSWVLLLLHLAYFSVKTLGSTVPAVAGEREHQSLDVLKSSGIPESEFIRSRFLEAVLTRTAELLLWSPLMLVPVALGLANPEQMLLLMGATVTLIGQWAALGLCCSAWSPTRFVAAQRAYGVLLLSVFGTLLLDFLFADPVLDRELLASGLNPLMGLSAIFWPRDIPLSSSCWILQGLLALPLLVAAAIGTRTRIEGRASRGDRGGSRGWRLAWRGNPVLYRELAAVRLGSRAVGYVSLMGATLAYGSWMVPDHNLDNWFVLAIYLHLFYFTGKALSAGVASIARERELKTWESLLSTTVTPEQLFWGKFGSVTLPLLGEMLCALPVFLGYAVSIRDGWACVLGLWLFTASWIALLAAGGIWLSNSMEASRAARAAAALTFTLCLGGPILDVFLTRDLFFSYTSPLVALMGLAAPGEVSPIAPLVAGLLYVVLASAIAPRAIAGLRTVFRCGLRPIPSYQRRIHLLSARAANDRDC
ncbi:MAG: hypothetical protein HY319_08445 [Armatimonadetes bacterium]|nr:hypothetical protein [Armatimonadota bacterium]